MPFVASGNAPEFTPKGFCCLQVNNKWKLHYFDGQTWKRINTALSEDATECSPTAEYANGKWQVSFIAGGFEADRRFYLYKIIGLENPKPQKIVQADVGFLWKNKIVYGSRIGEVRIAGGKSITLLKFPEVKYLYRVSYNPNNPQELLISGQDKSGKLFSWICNPIAKHLQSICVNDNPAYKAALFKGTLYYAKRNDNTGFEERHVVATNTFETSELCFSDLVQIETEKLTQPTTELLQHFTNSMANWAKSGFRIADAETLSKRKNLCSECEYWDTSAYIGLGKCKKCGCSSAKLRLESEHCPIGKW